MDHHAFDRLTRLCGASGSRRTAWRTLLAATLLGATTRPAAAKPCNNGKHLCGDTCCPGKCFVNDACRDELCCTGPERIICGNQCCKRVDEAGRKIKAPCSGECISPREDSCPTAITGSYRRR